MSSVQYIGHGRLESSPENFSILHVVSHELSHVQEFKNEAFRSGEDIAEIRVKLDLEMRENGKLVAVSGETTAVTRKREDNPLEGSLYRPYDRPKNGVLSALSDYLKQSSDIYGNANEIDSTESSELQDSMDKKESPEDIQRVSRKEYLEVRLSQLEAELRSRTEKSEHLVSQEAMISILLDPRANELEREKRKVEEEIRLISMEEETKKNFQFLAKAGREMMENAFSIGSLASNNSNRDRDTLDIRA